MVMKYLEYPLQNISLVREVCKPLFDNFPIKEIGYIKIFENGCFLQLSTNADWITKCYQTKIHDNYNYYKNLIDATEINKFRISLRVGPPDGGLNNFQYKNNLWNSLIIFNKGANFFEGLAFFASKDSVDILNLYLDNSDIFKKFMFYFKEKLYYIINPNDHSKLWKPSSFLKNKDKLFITNHNNKNKYAEFLSKINLTKFTIDEHKYITFREAECLFYFSKGYTVKEVAKAMEISIKTVETHLKNIQSKLDIFYKSGSIDFFVKHKLQEFFE